MKIILNIFNTEILQVIKSKYIIRVYLLFLFCTEISKVIILSTLLYNWILSE